jgi:hypothetical protein
MSTKKSLFSQISSWGIVVGISLFLVVGIVYAATTIGTSISTTGDLTASGSATTTARLVVGSKNPTTNDILWVGGGLFANSATTSDTLAVGGNAAVAGTLAVTGSSSLAALSATAISGTTITGTGNLFAKGGTYNFTTTTATTTLGLFVSGNTGTGTTTLGVGSATQRGCIELSSETGAFYRLTINAGALVVVAGRCN